MLLLQYCSIIRKYINVYSLQKKVKFFCRSLILLKYNNCAKYNTFLVKYPTTNYNSKFCT